MRYSITSLPWLRVRGKHQSGVTSVEYALLAAVISLALIAGLTATGDANADFITAVKNGVMKILGVKSAALGN